MVTYFAYDVNNPQAVVGERHTITNGKIRLRHVPAANSITISGFTEVASPNALHLNEFACLYSAETGYRESNRIVYFSTAHNATTVLVNYQAVGTVVTADDMNEIKAHLDAAAQKDSLNELSHNQFANDIAALQTQIAAVENYTLPTASASVKGGIKIGNGLSMTGDTLSADAYVLPTAGASILGGVKVGNGLEMDNDTLNVTITADDTAFFHTTSDTVCFPYVTGSESTWSVDANEQEFISYAGRASRLGDIVPWVNSGSTTGWAYRADNAWINLGTDILNSNWQLTGSWQFINPLLSLNDRAKLDALENYTLPVASASTLGGIKIGNGLSIAADGTLNVTGGYSVASTDDINTILNNIFGG